MRVEEKYIPCPDCDGDRVLPATYRNMAPWDSAFTRDGRLLTPQAATADADKKAPDSRAVDWLVWALMGHYND
ncbi:MAG: hypothetical protein ACE5HA_02930 [Anaerolineae bacterium]